MLLTSSAQIAAIQMGGGSIFFGGVLALLPNSHIVSAGLAAIISGILVAAYPWFANMVVTQTAQNAALQAGGSSIFLGGVLAQVPNPYISPAGIAAIISGILVAAYPWYVKTVDARGLTKKIEDLEVRLAADKATAEKLVASAKVEASEGTRLAREADINELAKLRHQLEDAKRLVDRLTPKMKVMEKATDVNTDAITKVADATGVPIDAAQKINSGQGPTNNNT